ncbi:MAG: hypothetical protein K2G67_03270 [Muribaculaceae bacterium]|nr:hypothetical protein [Muribaculaceae bacterium]
MKFKNFSIFSIVCLLLALFSPCLISCNKNSDDEPPVSEEDMRRVTLIYAVNNSSLRYDFKSDSIEIEKAMRNIDLRYYQVLVYKTVDKNNTALYKIVDKGGSRPTFEEIKRYERLTTSTSPQQIRNVVKDALSFYPGATYDLIFWGHGTAWRPENSDYTIGGSGPERGYGGEYNGNTTSSGMPITSWTNLDDLADAIPDHVFDHIWFDCCYMSSIEVIYQFRNKCNTFVGYPTEVMSEGMTYDEVLPYMVRETPDPTGAANAFFNHFVSTGQPATIAIIKMDKVEAMADAVKDVIKNCDVKPDSSDQINYSRLSGCKLVDLISYISDMAKLKNRTDLVDNLISAYNDMVIFSAATKTDFRNQYWDTSRIFGISTYYFIDYSNELTDYYKTLDWYKRVYLKD